LKRLFCLVAAVAVALVGAGGALAKSQGGHHGRKTHAKRKESMGSLVPRLDGGAPVWFQLLAKFPLDPKPLTRSAVHQRSESGQSPQPQHVTTASLYERTVGPRALALQGCEAAREEKSGVVVLDFGKLAYEEGGYGTVLFSNRFARNRAITTAMLGYARGYAKCLPRGSTASVTLARGTSDYHPAVPSAYTAGLKWAYWTKMLAALLQTRGLTDHLQAAAADDAEPAWDPHFHKTRDFLHGYRRAAQGRALYDYGSLDGGIGQVWTARQATIVAGSIRHTKVLPEIYSSAMADEWAELARVAKSRYHRPVEFAGVMTQGTSHCRCGLRPHAAHRVLAGALASAGVDQTSLPRGGTNIVG
jgi:hypothetical protein